MKNDGGVSRGMDDDVACFLTTESKHLLRKITKELDAIGARAIDPRPDEHKVVFIVAIGLLDQVRVIVGVERLFLCLFDHGIDATTCPLFATTPPDVSLIATWIRGVDLPLAKRRWERICRRPPETWAFALRRLGSVCRRAIETDEASFRAREAISCQLPDLRPTRYCAAHDAANLPDLAISLSLSSSRALAGLLLGPGALRPHSSRRGNEGAVDGSNSVKMSLSHARLPPTLPAHSRRHVADAAEGMADGVADGSVEEEVTGALLRLIGAVELQQQEARHTAQKASRQARRAVAASVLSSPDGCPTPPLPLDSLPKLRPLLLPLPIPCAYYDPAFLPAAEADQYLSSLLSPGAIHWDTHRNRTSRPTAVYGDTGVQYYYERG